MDKIHPVLLAGGAGTRLWPLSRKSYPKQFSQLLGSSTMLQDSAKRLTSSDIIEFAPIITVTNNDFRFIVAQQLQEVGIEPGPILIEPYIKNTAAAILAASVYAYSKDECAILLVAPSDHMMSNVNDFHEAIAVGMPHVIKGKFVSFGIRPTHPEIGYGYLELARDTLDNSGTSVVSNFVEKPDLKLANQMSGASNFLWNAGIYLFRARDMIEAFKTFAPGSLDLVKNSINDARVDLGFFRLASKPWSLLDNISIDYAIMEKVENLVAVPYCSKWSDLGSWDAVWTEGEQDSDGNVTSETAHAIECSNSLLRSENKNQHIVGIGLDNIIAVSMRDAVLVARKDYTQDVKRAVDLLAHNKVEQADTFPVDYRPWGWFESLVVGDYFQVKRINVKPKAALSLQSHKHRSEHWVVVEGNARVVIDNDVSFLTKGQSIYVPQGAVHRLENVGESAMELIEVQIGTYLGEDDIIRYDDRFGRV